MNIVFSDLDGTLLDHDTYSFQDASNAIDILKTHNIPLILCTSKTRAEIEYFKNKLGNNHPFISENGGAIFIPKEYFSTQFLFQKNTKNYYVIELGTSYRTLRKYIKILKGKYDIKSFADMSVKKVAEETNLDLKKASLAKNRDYSIPFKILKNEQTEDILKEIANYELQVTRGGRYYHLIGTNSKGSAVKILSYIFKKEFDEPFKSIGIGDSENDFPMLDVVDIPYLVMKPDNTYASSEYFHANGIGPVGWKKVIEREVSH